MCISCPQGYVQCATEGGFCDGVEMIAYGNDTQRYTYQEPPIDCTAIDFGDDPAPDHNKECCTQDPEIIGPPSLGGPIVGTIKCSQTIFAFFGYVDDVHYWKLTTNITYDITYMTCESSFDTRIHIYNSSNDIISLIECPMLATNTDPTKTGDDCNEDKCILQNNNEYFTLINQSPSDYYVEIISYDDDGMGDYQLTILCSIPTTSPTYDPTIYPTFLPTIHPTIIPTINPTPAPTANPTIQPTNTPSMNPTTFNPTASTLLPTIIPTVEPTLQPTNMPTIEPSAASISISPTLNPSYPTVDITGATQPTYKPTQTDIYTYTTIIVSDNGEDQMLESNSSSIMLLVKIICGASVVCCCLIIILFCYCRSRQSQNKKNKSHVHSVNVKQNKDEVELYELSCDHDMENTTNKSKLNPQRVVSVSSDNDVIDDGDLNINAVLINNTNATDWKCLNCEIVNDKTHVICARCFTEKHKVVRKEADTDDDDDESDSEELEQIQQRIQMQQQIWIQQQIEKQQQMKKEEKMKQQQMQQLQQMKQQQLLGTLPEAPSALQFDAQITARMSLDPNGVPELLNVDEQAEIDAYHEGVDGDDDDEVNSDVVKAQSYRNQRQYIE